MTDSANATADHQFTVVILDALGISTASLPGGTVGQAYSATLQATGGATPYTWSVASGALPAGLTLNTSTGAITGTPSTAGTSSFTARVADASSQSATQAFSVTIVATAGALSISTASLPGGTVGQAYSATLQATGGTPPYTWSVAAGALPAGLSLNASTGAITGTPSTAGTVNFTASVIDSVSQTATKALSIAVASNVAPLSISTTSLLGGTVGQAYSATLQATGGTPPYTWSLASGALPAGLSLNASTGAISGTPTSAALFTFTVRVADAGGLSATQALSLNISSSASSVGCGATNGGAAPFDQSTCGNVTTDGAVLSYEPNYNDASATVVSACGSGFSTAGSFKLTADLACGANSTAFSITPSGGQSGFYVNLNGHTVTGRIISNDNNGGIPNGLHIFGGAVNCNGGSCINISQSNNCCVLSSGMVLHHLTLHNLADAGDTAAIDGAMTSTMSGGAYSADIHHIEVILSGGTSGDPSRTSGISVTGYNHTVHYHNNFIHNSSGTNHGASEGLGCYQTFGCDINNNYCSFNQMTLANGTVGRCILLDGDGFGNGITTPGFTENANVFNNYFNLNDTRGVRQRSARRVQVHDNLFDNMTDTPNGPSYLGAIHWGDPTSAQGGTSTYDYLNSLYNNNRFVFAAPTQSGGIAFHGMSATNISFKDNQISCVGTGCSSNTQAGAAVEASVQALTGSKFFNVTVCRFTYDQPLLAPLHGNGSGQTQTSTINHSNAGSCSAINGATCNSLPSCP